eukprot:1212463-Rhodomonas_salina.1
MLGGKCARICHTKVLIPKVPRQFRGGGTRVPRVPGYPGMFQPKTITRVGRFLANIPRVQSNSAEVPVAEVDFCPGMRYKGITINKGRESSVPGYFPGY